MTRDELDAATDEQLNEMAAISLFDWEHWEGPTGFKCFGPPDGGHRGDAPEFCTDWSAVGEVIQRMRSKGLHLDLDDEIDVYYAAFSEADMDSSVFASARHKSAPRAITTAALLAWGEKEKA